MTTKPLGYDIRRNKQRDDHIHLNIKGCPSLIAKGYPTDHQLRQQHFNKMLSLSNECVPENSSDPTTKTEITVNDQQAKQHTKSHPKGKFFRRNLSSRSLFSGKASAKITPSNHEYHRSASRISIISGKSV